MRSIITALALCVLVACAGCSSLNRLVTSISYSAEVQKVDENNCSAANLRFCLGEIWLYFKLKLSNDFDFVLRNNTP